MATTSTANDHEVLERRLRDMLLSPKVRADPQFLAGVARGVLERVQEPAAKAAWWRGDVAPVIHTTRTGKGANRYADGRALVSQEVGAPIFAGECLATAPNTFASVRWPNGVAVWLGPDSALAIESTDRNTCAARLMRGSMLSFVPPEEGSALRVQVGKSEAITRNARWQLRVLAEGGARLDVLGGEVISRHDKAAKSGDESNEATLSGRQSQHLGGEDRRTPVALSKPEKQLGWIGALGNESDMPEVLATAFGMFFQDGFPSEFDATPASAPKGGKSGGGIKIPLPSRRTVIAVIVIAALGGGGWWWYKEATKPKVYPWQMRPANDPLRVPPPRNP